MATSNPYGGTPPYQKHSETSEEAARSVKRNVGGLHLTVLDYLRKNPRGATDEELIEGTRLPPNTLRPRRRELQLMGRVIDSGIKRSTKSGRKAVVWLIADTQKI